MKTKTGFKLRQIGDEYVLMPVGVSQINFNKIITLNESAALVWKKIENTDFDKDSIKNILLEEYEISEQQADTDAAQTIKDWIKAELIEQA